MTQGAENDLKDIRYYTRTSEILFTADNEPVEDLNDNTLTVDNKAIGARDLADDVTTDLAAHIGGIGVAEHGESTLSDSGFMSAGEKSKLDRIDSEAQVNVLSIVDALELVGGGATSQHLHPNVTDSVDGFMTAVLKSKLNTIESGAEVNILTAPQVAGLTGGGDANPLHTHVTPTFFETFREGPGTDGVPSGVTYHSNVDHTGLPGVPGAFPGFLNESYNDGPVQIGAGIKIFPHIYTTMTTLHVIDAGFSYFIDTDAWGWGSAGGVDESFHVTNVEISGSNTGVVTYEAKGAFTRVSCWQGGYGL